MKPKTAYLVDCYGQSGGSYMMYNIGKILTETFDYRCICVLIRHTYMKGRKRWNYEHHFEHVNQDEMECQITEQDLLICHEYYSKHFWGRQLPGFKIMYIQAFTTVPVLDPFFDAYCCASNFLASFFKQLYQIEATVIPPFLHLDNLPHLPNWESRDSNKVFVMGKQFFKPILQIFKQTMQELYPDIPLHLTTVSQVPHKEVLTNMANHRYFLWLSPAEGFGLPPLEAMACGCTVVGFHSKGGQHYMQSGENCLTTEFPNIETVCHHLTRVIQDAQLAKKLAEAAPSTAIPYSKIAFEKSWKNTLTLLLKKKSV